LVATLLLEAADRRPWFPSPRRDTSASTAPHTWARTPSPRVHSLHRTTACRRGHGTGDAHLSQRFTSAFRTPAKIAFRVRGFQSQPWNRLTHHDPPQRPRSGAAEGELPTATPATVDPVVFLVTPKQIRCSRARLRPETRRSQSCPPNAPLKASPGTCERVGCGVSGASTDSPSRAPGPPAGQAGAAKHHHMQASGCSREKPPRDRRFATAPRPRRVKGRERRAAGGNMGLMWVNRRLRPVRIQTLRSDRHAAEEPLANYRDRGRIIQQSNETPTTNSHLELAAPTDVTRPASHPNASDEAK